MKNLIANCLGLDIMNYLDYHISWIHLKNPMILHKSINCRMRAVKLNTYYAGLQSHMAYDCHSNQN